MRELPSIVFLSLFKNYEIFGDKYTYLGKFEFIFKRN